MKIKFFVLLFMLTSKIFAANVNFYAILEEDCSDGDEASIRGEYDLEVRENDRIDDLFIDALEKCQEERILFFIEQGVNPNLIHNQLPVLWTAIKKSSPPIARILLTAGADVNGGALDNIISPPLIYVMEKGDLDMMKVLLSFNPNLNLRNNQKMSAVDLLHIPTILPEIQDLLMKYMVRDNLFTDIVILLQRFLFCNVGFLGIV